MGDYRHHISGFFAHRAQAEDVVSKIIGAGIPEQRVHLFDKFSVLPTHIPKNSDDKVLKDVLVDGAIGAAVGTGLGALVEVGLLMSSVTLFVASPLIAPLVLLGWGAGLGGIVGATVGSGEKVRPLSDLVHDAILSGQIVVVADTLTPEETSIASGIVQASIGDYSDAV